MSGGRFDYAQHRILDIVDELDGVLAEPPSRYTPETMDKFRVGRELLRMAHVYAQRIDWLLSGDDGEESFHRRLDEDLEKLRSETR